MLAIKDADFVVRLDAYKIASRAKMTEREVLDGLEILMSPDKRRIEKQPFDGRRVAKIEGGYLILNGEKYRDMIRKIKRRTYKTDWQRQKRNKGKVESRNPAQVGDNVFKSHPQDPETQKMLRKDIEEYHETKG